MSSGPAPPSEEPGAREPVVIEDDGTEPATAEGGWRKLMRTLGRDTPAALAVVNSATRQIKSRR
jgi:hypothetical protein